LELSGVEGGGTFPEKNAEQERPYLAAKSGKDRAYKTGRLKARGAGRESEGFKVPKKACKKTRWREGALPVFEDATDVVPGTTAIRRHPGGWALL
jgi:hypothetical protein